MIIKPSRTRGPAPRPWDAIGMPRQRALRRHGLAPVLLGLFAACVQPPTDLDLLVLGGRVVDGSGAPPRRTDVGIRGDSIAWIGRPGAHATDTLDAVGMVVAPGFIDAHSHTISTLFGAGSHLNEAMLRQGVTTVVDGPDGLLGPDAIAFVASRAADGGLGTNLALYVGHNAVRAAVMGEDQDRAPDGEELDSMRALVRRGMELGALGLSTGLELTPGEFSDTEEVVALALEVAPFRGVYDSHVRDPVGSLLASDAEALEIARRAGIPGALAHERVIGYANRGAASEVVARVEEARRHGQEIVAGQIPYTHDEPTPLWALFVPPDELPGLEAFRSLLDGDEASLAEGLAELTDALGDRRARGAILEASRSGRNERFVPLTYHGVGSLRILAGGTSGLEGAYLGEAAAELGVDAYELAADLVSADGDAVVVTPATIEEDDFLPILLRPWTMIVSDADPADGSDEPGGHPRNAGAFARLFGHYVRERGDLELESAVRKVTSLPADFLGLTGRGCVRPGCVADVVVFDPATIAPGADWEHPRRYAEGVLHVVVNGVPVLRGGALTGATPGRFLPRVRGAR